MSKLLKNFLSTHLILIFYFSYFCYLYHDLSVGSFNSNFFYISLFIFLLVIPIIKPKILFKFSYVDYIPISIIISAIVGVLVALHNNIEPYFILRNSIGLFMFVFYFIFSLYFKPEELTRDMIKVSILANIFILMSLILRNEFYFLGLGSQRFIYSSLIAFAFIIFPYLLNKLFDTLFLNQFSLTNFIFNLINVVIVFTNVYIVSLSKGALLGLVTISVIYVLLKFYHMGKITLTRAMHFFSLMYFIFLICLQVGIAERIFGSKDISNQSRFLQNDFLFRETSFWGNGLGSYLLNGFYRDGNLKYAYEATFFNFWNKLGVFWFLILISFAFGIFLLFKIKNFNSAALVCLGTFFYILISLGNPTLFAPSYVILACQGLLLIRNNFLIKVPSEK